MKIFQLLQNPLVKIIGVATVLYFGLLYKNDDPESLKVRLDPDRLKVEIDEVKNQGQFIMTNLNDSKTPFQAPAPKKKIIEISSHDLILGNGGETVKCGDEVLVDYNVYDSKGNKIDHKKDAKFSALPYSANPIAKYIIGARKGSIREINVPYNLETQNKEILDYREKAANSFKYQVTIKNINSANGAQNCTK